MRIQIIEKKDYTLSEGKARPPLVDNILFLKVKKTPTRQQQQKKRFINSNHLQSKI